MEIVCLDYLSLERSKGGYESILVITDHFSRYAQAIPTRNQTAKTTARVLFDNFVVHYGFPARIHSDQGANFESQLIKELCQIAKVEKSRTTPYHRMGNGQVERFNQTLLQMLGTLEEYQKSDWKALIPTLVHAYNATFHDSTGYSPFFLMFGRHPRLAIDAFLGLTPDSLSGTCHSDYIRKLRDRLNFAYKKAEEEAKQSAAVHKKHYDSNVRNSVLQPGDLVLVRRVGIKGKNKLGDRWEQDPYIIVEQPNGDIPVYAVKRQNNRSKKIRLLHRSLLLPFMGLPRLEEELEADDEVTVNESAGQRSDVMDNPSADLPCSDTSVVFFEDKDGTATETGLSVDSDSDDQKPGKYKIPMLRKAGESGLLPRSSGSSHSRSSSVSESSSDEGDSTPKPTRARRKPHWMKSDDWLVGQQHTFYVDPDQVVHL